MDETRTLDDVAGEVLDNYINGNFSDVKRLLGDLSPLNAAAVVAEVHIILATASPNTRIQFMAHIARQWESD